MTSTRPRRISAQSLEHGAARGFDVVTSDTLLEPGADRVVERPPRRGARPRRRGDRARPSGRLADGRGQGLVGRGLRPPGPRRGERRGESLHGGSSEAEHLEPGLPRRRGRGALAGWRCCGGDSNEAKLIAGRVFENARPPRPHRRDPAGRDLPDVLASARSTATTPAPMQAARRRPRVPRRDRPPGSTTTSSASRSCAASPPTSTSPASQVRPAALGPLTRYVSRSSSATITAYGPAAASSVAYSSRDDVVHRQLEGIAAFQGDRPPPATAVVARHLESTVVERAGECADRGLLVPAVRPRRSDRRFLLAGDPTSSTPSCGPSAGCTHVYVTTTAWPPAAVLTVAVAGDSAKSSVGIMRNRFVPLHVPARCPSPESAASVEECSATVGDSDMRETGSVTCRMLLTSVRPVVLLTGIPASGKSTVADLLARSFERGVHVRGDVFRRMVVAGRAEMSPTPSQEAWQQLRLRYHLGAHSSDAYHDAGFSVVVQDVIIGAVLADYVAAVRADRWSSVGPRAAARHRRRAGGPTEQDRLLRRRLRYRRPRPGTPRATPRGSDSGWTPPTSALAHRRGDHRARPRRRVVSR